MAEIKPDIAAIVQNVQKVGKFDARAPMVTEKSWSPKTAEAVQKLANRKDELHTQFAQKVKVSPESLEAFYMQFIQKDKLEPEPHDLAKIIDKFAYWSAKWGGDASAPTLTEEARNRMASLSKRFEGWRSYWGGKPSGQELTADAAEMSQKLTQDFQAWEQTWGGIPQESVAPETKSQVVSKLQQDLEEWATKWGGKTDAEGYPKFYERQRVDRSEGQKGWSDETKALVKKLNGRFEAFEKAWGGGPPAENDGRWSADAKAAFDKLKAGYAGFLQTWGGQTVSNSEELSDLFRLQGKDGGDSGIHILSPDERQGLWRRNERMPFPQDEPGKFGDLDISTTPFKRDIAEVQQDYFPEGRYEKGPDGDGIILGGDGRVLLLFHKLGENGYGAVYSPMSSEQLTVQLAKLPEDKRDELLQLLKLEEKKS